MGKVRTLDVKKRQITLSDGHRIDYDAALLATGGKPQRPDLPGATALVIGLAKPSEAEFLAKLKARVAEAGMTDRILFTGMIPDDDLLRVLRGPTEADRMMAAQLFGSGGVAILLLLAFACTLLPFALSLVALKHLSAYGVQLVTNLEPVYAIVLAIVLLGEQRELTPLFYLGVGIILAAVFLHPLTQRPKRIEHPEVLGTSEAKNIVE